MNGCWIPLARYYGLAATTATATATTTTTVPAAATATTSPAASLEAVLAARPKDDPEDVFEMVEEMYGVHT